MTVVNTSVFSESSKRTILPWTIVQFLKESHSFTDFFIDVVKPRMISNADCQIISASVGPDKTSLDQVDISLQILSVLHLFGRFLKYFVKIEEDVSVSSDSTIDLIQSPPLSFLYRS